MGQFEKPDFIRHDGKKFFLTDRAVLPLDSKVAKKHGLSSPYHRDEDIFDVLGPLGVVLTPSDIKRCFDRWVKAGAPPVDLFSDSVKRVNEFERRKKADAELDAKQIERLEVKIKETEAKVEDVKCTLTQVQEKRTEYKNDLARALDRESELRDARDQWKKNATDLQYRLDSEVESNEMIQGVTNTALEVLNDETEIEVFKEVLQERMPHVASVVFPEKPKGFWGRLKSVFGR